MGEDLGLVVGIAWGDEGVVEEKRVVAALAVREKELFSGLQVTCCTDLQGSGVEGGLR